MTARPTTRLEQARGYPDLFALAKDLVEAHLGRRRGGIMVGLQRLGLSPAGYLGGYFVVGSNAIVLNRDVLDYVQLEAPDHHHAYAFYVLLHEYLHSVGLLDEGQVRSTALTICRDAFGEEHPASLVAAAVTPGQPAPGAPEVFRRLVNPPFGWEPRDGGRIEYVKGLDVDDNPYIA